MSEERPQSFLYRFHRAVAVTLIAAAVITVCFVVGVWAKHRSRAFPWSELLLWPSIMIASAVVWWRDDAEPGFDWTPNEGAWGSRRIHPLAMLWLAVACAIPVFVIVWLLTQGAGHGLATISPVVLWSVAGLIVASLLLCVLTARRHQ